MAREIYQGSQFPIALQIQIDGAIATPDNVKAVRITFGHIEQTWPNGKLTFSNGYWIYNLTQEYSLKLCGETPLQGQVSPDGIRFYPTPISYINVKESILKGTFDINAR